MQLPLIRDGIVVNVIEIDEDTISASKGDHKRLSAEENAEYEARASEWRAAINAHAEAIKAAEMQLFPARGAANAVKSDVRKSQGDAQKALNRVLVADAEVEAWEAKVADMRVQPLPSKPQMVRGKRWICPDDAFLGPAGGAIGDLWDGKAYSKPTAAEKAMAAV